MRKRLIFGAISLVFLAMVLVGCQTKETGKAAYLGNETNCTNDCSYSGQKTCSGNYSKTCGNYDEDTADTCLEWSPGTYCQYGCVNGNCQSAPLPTGSLYATSNPSGAKVSVDNVYKGLTPIRVGNVQTGTRSVKFTKSGYNDVTKSPIVYAGKTTNVNATLTPVQNQTGNLYVASNPTAANLYVDNVLKGTTPKTVTGLTVGNHAVKVTKTGYSDYTTTAYIYAGQTATINATLRALPTTNQTGSIYATSSPSGASVSVDKVYKGLTPVLVGNVQAGTRSVQFSKFGYNNVTKSAIVYAGKTTNVNATLAPE